MLRAGEGALAWDWERPEVQEAVAKLKAQYDPQLLLLIGLLCLVPFGDQISDDLLLTLNEAEASRRLVNVLSEFQLSNERGIRALWVTILGLVAGIWAKEDGQPGRAAGPRLRRVAFRSPRESPGE